MGTSDDKVLCQDACAVECGAGRGRWPLQNRTTIGELCSSTRDVFGACFSKTSKHQRRAVMQCAVSFAPLSAPLKLSAMAQGSETNPAPNSGCSPHTC
eukprot:336215-Amphidinium_carterae.1